MKHTFHAAPHRFERRRGVSRTAAGSGSRSRRRFPLDPRPRRVSECAEMLKHRPSPATAIALVALFVALGGTGYAATDGEVAFSLVVP